MSKREAMKIWIDGACWPNPGGPGGWGVVIQQPGGETVELKGTFPAGPTSNNYAEYLALQAALIWLGCAPPARVTIYSDSQLLVHQMTGRWKIKNGAYARTAREAKEWIRQYGRDKISIRWIPRERNTVADGLSKGE